MRRRSSGYGKFMLWVMVRCGKCAVVGGGSKVLFFLMSKCLKTQLSSRDHKSSGEKGEAEATTVVKFAVLIPSIPSIQSKISVALGSSIRPSNYSGQDFISSLCTSFLFDFVL